VRLLAAVLAAELERLAELASDPLTRRRLLEAAASAERAGDVRRCDLEMRRAA